MLQNVFCPTGPGGGIDPTCSPSDSMTSEDYKYAVVSRMKGGLERSRLSKELKAKYVDRIDRAVSSLEKVSPNAMKRLAYGVTSAVFYKDQASLAKGVGIGRDTAGAYDYSKGVLHLNGGPDSLGTYVHEMWHGVDGKDFKLSRSDAWKEAWKQEIVDTGIVSRYARTNATEGFAEFGRFLHQHFEFMDTVAAKIEVERRLPKCVAFFKDNDLW